MAYAKQNFVDGEVLNATKLNHIEDGLNWNIIKPEDGISTNDIADLAVSKSKIENGAVSAYYTATITTTWEGTTEPYTQGVFIQGIEAADTPIIDLKLSDVYDTASQEIDAWSNIYRIVADTNLLTVYATDKTEIPLTIQIRCIRK